MLARTIASYTEKNMNSEISIQCAILVGTNGTTTLSRIPTIIRGKDGRGKTPLLQIKTIKGLKRENIMPLCCGTYLSLTV
jgi:phosphomannomutase